jgi:ABC-type lipoprotein export system ATPase subunit
LGILPPTTGRVLVNGEDIYQYDPKQMANFQTKTIGIIYQAFYLIPSLSVLDNVSLPLIFAEWSAGEREQRAHQLLQRFGVDAQADKLPAALSGGQNQRVAVSRALVSDPLILLADEPVGNLDSTSTKAVMDTLDEINIKDKKTIILVTHDAKHLPYAHRVYYMKDGRVEREVPNPQKQQIKSVERGKMIVTELEKLTRFYPYNTPQELKVKSVMNYITQDVNFDQLERMEHLVQQIIEGKMLEEDFFAALMIPFEKGGIGLTRTYAKEIITKLDKVLKQSLDVARFRRNVESERKPEEQEQKKLVKRLRAYVVDEYPGQINLMQLRRLDELIEKRVMGDIRGDSFQKALATSLAKGGVGFGRRTAAHLTDFLEKLIVQGINK